MRRLLWMTCAALLTWSAPVRSADLSCLVRFDPPTPEDLMASWWPSGFRPSSSACRVALLRGPIEEGDFEKVRTFLGANQRTLWQVYLDSPGGSVGEALQIGGLFRTYLMRVSAPLNVDGFRFMMHPSPGMAGQYLCKGDTCVCASACALIWFGASFRFGAVGIHRPLSTDPEYRKLSPADASAHYRRIIEAMKTYGEAMEIPRPIMDKMLATGSGEIKFVSTADDPDLSRSPSLGEWADASCGRISLAEDQGILRLTEKEARGTLIAPEAATLQALRTKSRQHSMCEFGLRMRAVDALPRP